MKVKYRYFVTRGDAPEREVDADQYLYAQVHDAGISVNETQNAIAFDKPHIRGRIKTEIEE